MTWNFDIENIAGIRRGSVTIEPGVNAVRASNWQGKSSFLTAIETVMGADGDLTEGVTDGRVRLTTDDGTFVVDLTREGDTVVRHGDPYLDDEATRAAASLYAFLGEDNAVRRAVWNHENLESVLTRPLDFENLDERIADLRAERDQVETELERATDAARALPEVESRVAALEQEREELREERAALAAETTGSSDVREELSGVLAERKNVGARINRLERAVERTREKLTECRAEIDDFEVPETSDDLEQQLADTRERHDRKRRDAELLQSVYAPTKRILDEDRLDLITDVDHGLLDDGLRCWTCGTETTEEAVRERLDALGERVTTLREAADEAKATVETIEERLEDRRDAERREADLERRISDLARTLEDREASLDRARERHDELDDRVDDLAADVVVEDDRLTDVKSDLKYTEARLEDAREKRKELAARAEPRETLEATREELTDELTRLRTRKKTVKRQTREAFDTALGDVLDRFETGFETARLTSNFDLVVARDGREASLDALSEGEVELLGIVAALAGHETFETAADVPVMLVDNLGSLTDENLQTLVSYLETRVEYLVVTAYPEHSTFEGHTVEASSWTVAAAESA